MHTPFDWAGVETSAGVDALIVGPQTKISALQDELHDLFGLPEPTVFGAQIGDAVYLTAVGEFGKPFALGRWRSSAPMSKRRRARKRCCGLGGIS